MLSEAQFIITHNGTCILFWSGVFLDLYVILIFGGLPIVSFELVMGKYFWQGAIGVWYICPIIQGKTLSRHGGDYNFLDFGF